jgi:hypothetical protein
LTGLVADADLYVYTAATLTDSDCFPNGRTLGEECVTTATGNTLYIVIKGMETAFGTPFDLRVGSEVEAAGDFTCDDMEINNASNQGQLASPEVAPNLLQTGDYLDNIGRNGTHASVAKGGSSYYVIPTLGRKPQIVSLSNLNSETYLYIYSDAEFADELGRHDTPSGAQAVTSTRTTTVTPPGDSLYVRVDGGSSGDCFTLAALAAEGSASAPVDVRANKQSNGVVDQSVSYYRASVEPGVLYPFDFVQPRFGEPLSVGVAARIYGADGFEGTPLCEYTVGEEANECVNLSSTSEFLYLTLDGSGTTVGGYVEFCLGACSSEQALVGGK